MCDVMGEAWRVLDCDSESFGDRSDEREVDVVLQPLAPSKSVSRYRFMPPSTTATLGRSNGRAKSDPQSCPIQPPHGVPGGARRPSHIGPSRVHLCLSDTLTALANPGTYMGTPLPLSKVSSQTLVLQTISRRHAPWPTYRSTPASTLTRRASTSTPTMSTAPRLVLQVTLMSIPIQMSAKATRSVPD